MNVAKLSTVFLSIVVSLCLAYAITYLPTYNTAKQMPVTLRIKPVVLNAVVDIKPDTINLRSKGRWVVSYIELPKTYNVSDIDVSTIKLNGTVSAELKPIAIGDYDDDAVPDLMVKLKGASVSELILAKGIMVGNVTLTITGQLYDGTAFEGCDIIKVRMPTK